MGHGPKDIDLTMVFYHKITILLYAGNISLQSVLKEMFIKSFKLGMVK